jgi:Outer membrane protein beta-barrel domain
LFLPHPALLLHPIKQAFGTFNNSKGRLTLTKNTFALDWAILIKLKQTMKKLFVAAFTLLSTSCLFAQTDSNAKSVVDTTPVRQTLDTTPVQLNQTRPSTSSAMPEEKKMKPGKKDWSKVNLANRANDHFMIQFGYLGWAQRPDSIHTTGIGRFFNGYFMFDLPFKTDPRISVGIGAGLSADNIYFDKQEVGIAANSATLGFPNKADTIHFKKYKLVNAYLEAPIELRYVADPEHSSKSWKAAIGIKVGTMLQAHTKGKNLVSSSGTLVRSFIEKENSKRFFNTTKIAATARVGIGVFSLFGQYQLSTLVKEGLGPTVRPFQIGITLSGL